MQKKFKKPIVQHLYFLLTNIIVLGIFFLFVFNNELIVFAKEIIHSLPVGSSFFEAIALKFYMIIGALANSPSVFAILFVVLHMMFLSFGIELIIHIIFAVFDAVRCSPIVLKKVSAPIKQSNNTYLETLRLRP